MSNLKKAIYTTINGKLGSKAKDLALQSRFKITVGGEDSDYPTNGLNDTEQLQAAIDEATLNPFGGEVIVVQTLNLVTNPAFTEQIGSGFRKAAIRARDNVYVRTLPNAWLRFHSGDPGTPLNIVKGGCFYNFGNVTNFNVDCNFDGLSSTTGDDSDEHAAVNFDGRGPDGNNPRIATDCFVKANCVGTAGSATIFRSVGVSNIVIDITCKNCDCTVTTTLGAKDIYIPRAYIDGSYAEGLLIAETSNVFIGTVIARNVEREGLRITDTFRKIGCSNIFIDSVFVKNGKDGISGVCIEGGQNILIDRIYAEDCNKHGLFIGKPTIDARELANIVVNSAILKNNNQRIRTVPTSTDAGLRLFNSTDVTINNLVAIDDQVGTGATPKIVVTGNGYTLTNFDKEFRTFGSNPTGTGPRTFLIQISNSFLDFNKTITFIDDKNNAATDNITITATGQTINGGSSAVINTNGGFVNLRWNGTGWETAVATQHKGFFSDGGEINLNIIGGKSSGNLNPSTYVGQNSNIWLHNGVENRVVNNFGLFTRVGSNGNSLRVFYQDTTNNKEAAIIDNDGTNEALTILQDGILATDRRALDIQVRSDIANSGSAGLYVSSSINNTGASNGLATIIQSGATSVSNLLRLVDGGAATSVFLQKTGTFNAGANALRVNIDSVMSNNDNHGVNIVSSQAHTGVSSSLLRVFNSSATSVARCISVENAGASHGVFIQQTGTLLGSQRAVNVVLSGALVNAGSSGLSVISSVENTQVVSTLLNVENFNASSVNRAASITDAGSGFGLLVVKTNASGSALRVETAGTTSFGHEIIATALTTGSALRVFSNSANTSVRSLQIIENNNVAAIGAIPLELKNSAPSAAGFRSGILFTGNGTLRSQISYGNGTSPNGVLTGTPGDLVINALGNQMFLCVGTAPSTTWVSITALQSADVVLTTSSGTTNALSGRITTASLTTAAGATQTFTITNNRVTANDDVIVTFKSYDGTTGKPEVRGYTTSAGQFTFDLLNAGAAVLNGVVIVNYRVEKKY